MFGVLVACPGPGYDTSTTLLSNDTAAAWPIAYLQNLVRWDSLYFVHAAKNGYVFEQEWAFGYGYTGLLAFLASGN